VVVVALPRPSSESLTSDVLTGPAVREVPYTFRQVVVVVLTVGRFLRTPRQPVRRIRRCIVFTRTRSSSVFGSVFHTVRARLTFDKFRETTKKRWRRYGGGEEDRRVERISRQPPGAIDCSFGGRRGRVVINEISIDRFSRSGGEPAQPARKSPPRRVARLIYLQ